MKNRGLSQIRAKECPMAYENCLCGCPFYCGVTISIHIDVGAAVICGWTREMQKKLEGINHDIIKKN